MSYFLTNQNLALGKTAELDGEEARHILLSRRMKKGDRFNLQGADEKRYAVEIKEIDRDKLKLSTLSEVGTPPEPTVAITLFQSYVNEKALDFIFQKSTELGAHKIILFNSQNTAVKLAADQFQKKSARWNKILWEAAKQSDRVRPPELEYFKSLEDIALAAKNFDKVFLCDISGQPIKNYVNLIQSCQSCSIIIGPEGGFIQTEIDKFKSLPNCAPISLGPILLRAETAALASLSLIRNLSE